MAGLEGPWKILNHAFSSKAGLGERNMVEHDEVRGVGRALRVSEELRGRQGFSRGGGRGRKWFRSQGAAKTGSNSQEQWGGKTRKRRGIKGLSTVKASYGGVRE